MSTTPRNSNFEPLPGADGFTHTQLSLGIEATGAFFGAGTQYVGKTILGEVISINDTLSDITGYSGSFGLGYPFYALDPSTDNLLKVPAIETFIDQSLLKVDASRETVGEHWPCVGCQETNKLPDLKTLCKPCDKTVFKPRDLFKALPDIDVVAVFDERSSAIEASVQERLAERDLLQSDTDIRGSFTRAMQAMAGQEGGKLPVDVHIWPRPDFEACCDQLAAHPDDTSTEILSRSLHTSWEDNPINFWFDFVFSLTEVGAIDPALQEVVDTTRSELVGKLGVDGVLALIPQVSRRGGAIIEDSSIKQLLQARIESWR